MGIASCPDQINKPRSLETFVMSEGVGKIDRWQLWVYAWRGHGL